MREGSHDRDISLRDQFKAFLRRQGINVVFDSDEDEVDAPQEEETRNNERRGNTHISERESARRLSRRASFNKIEESMQLAKDQFVSIDGELPQRPRSENELRPIKTSRDRRIAQNNDATNGKTVQPRSRMNQHSPIVPDEEFPPQPRRKPVVQIREDPSIYEFEDSIASDEVSETDEDESGVIGGFLYPHPQGRLLKDSADSLRLHRRGAQAHDVFHDWHRKARKQRILRQDQQRQAVASDRRVLKKQAFEQLRNGYLRHRSERETERFFGALETRAKKARDLFLLTKSFTHWAHSAAHEISRTSAARRHIIRTRYFNAWRDITAVNELKVRRQGLSKIFSTWKQRSARIASLNERASGFYSAHLLHESYQDWFWKYCDHRVPAWYDSKIQTRILELWSQSSHKHVARNRWSQDYARQQLLRKVLATWRTRVQIQHQQDVQAMAFERQRTLHAAIESLRRVRLFGNPVARLSTDHNQQVLQKTFHVWHGQTRSLQAARSAHRNHVLRGIWDLWNQKLRCRTVSRMMDDRIVVQALYSWVIAERLALFRRVANDKLKRKLFASWKQRMYGLCSHLGKAEHWVRTARDIHPKTLAMRRWSIKSKALALDEDCATKQFDVTATRRAFGRWKSRWAQVQEHRHYAFRINILLFAAPALEKWQQKRDLSKKQQRRDAFAQMRHQRHDQLVRNTWRTWREAARIAMIQDSDAEARREFMLLARLLNTWGSKTKVAVLREDQAQDMSRRLLLQRSWKQLLHRRELIHDAEDQAEALRFERIELLGAETSLRKLNRQLFQIKALHQTAESLRRYNEEKHFRLMLRYWNDQAQGKRRDEIKEDFAAQQQSRHDSGSLPAAQGAVTSINAEATSAALGTPAYLRTPSRRTTGRLKTRIPPAPVTPAPSQITPFWNRIEALKNPDGHHPFRRAQTDRLERRRRPFEDIAETSPIRGGGNE